MTHFCRFYGEMFYNLGRQYLISPGVHARDNLGKLKPFFVKKRIMLSCRKRPTTLKALWFHILWFRFIYTMVIYYICKTFAFNVKKTISCFNLKIWSWLNLRRHVEVMKQIHFSSHIKKILIQLCFNPPVQFTCNSLVNTIFHFLSTGDPELKILHLQFSRPKISCSSNSVTRAALFQHWSRDETTPSESNKGARR